MAHVYRGRMFTMAVPTVSMDEAGFMGELTQFIRGYLEEKGDIFMQEIAKAAERAVDGLPSEWADNFINSLKKEIRQHGSTYMALVVGSDYPDSFNDNGFVQAMVMEAGSSDVWTGPRGRLVWQDDRLAGGRGPSRVDYARQMPEHAPSFFFADTAEMLMLKFFDDMQRSIAIYVSTSGIFQRHLKFA